VSVAVLDRVGAELVAVCLFASTSSASLPCQILAVYTGPKVDCVELPQTRTRRRLSRACELLLTAADYNYNMGKYKHMYTGKGAKAIKVRVRDR
jgi:hypothetical protein